MDSDIDAAGDEHPLPITTVGDGPSPPPSPKVPTRVALPSLIGGNLAFAGLLFALWSDIVPNWLLLIAAFVVAAIGGFIESRNSERLTGDFKRARLAEIRDYFPDEQSAAERVATDLKENVDLEPMRSAIAIPMLFATFAVPIMVFLDVDRAQSDLFWLWRWPLAAIVAALFWLIFGAVWAFANLTPAASEIDFSALRGETGEIPDLDPEDQNDIHIIREMANLESLHRKIDTYTLEGALLSALSFSSFLSIVLADRDYASQLQTLFSPQLEHLHAGAAVLPVIGPLDGLAYPSAQYLGEHIVGWIAISLLLCATTFLGVLVARLRFNDGYRDAESALKAAERLNELEASALERDQSVKAAAYSRSIEELLRRAVELQDGLTYNVMHMRWSRNAGILCFVATLILCGFFFNAWVAGLIASIFAVAVLFGSIDRQQRGQLRRRIFGRGGPAALLAPLRNVRERG
jgi:hypothetical protein